MSNAADTQRKTPPCWFRTGATRARCQRKAPSLVRMRYSSSHGSERATASPQTRAISAWSSGCTATRAPLSLSVSTSVKPVSSYQRSLTHSRRPRESHVQMIWGNALASARYSSSFLESDGPEPRTGAPPRRLVRALLFLEDVRIVNRRLTDPTHSPYRPPCRAERCPRNRARDLRVQKVDGAQLNAVYSAI